MTSDNQNRSKNQVLCTLKGDHAPTSLYDVFVLFLPGGHFPDKTWKGKVRVCVCAASSASWPGLDGTQPYVGARRPSLLVSVILARIWLKPQLNSSPNPLSQREKKGRISLLVLEREEITPSQRMKRLEATSRTSVAAMSKSGVTASWKCGKVAHLRLQNQSLPLGLTSIPKSVTSAVTNWWVTRMSHSAYLLSIH